MPKHPLRLLPALLLATQIPLHAVPPDRKSVV